MWWQVKELTHFQILKASTIEGAGTSHAFAATCFNHVAWCGCLRVAAKVDDEMPFQNPPIRPHFDRKKQFLLPLLGKCKRA